MSPSVLAAPATTPASARDQPPQPTPAKAPNPATTFHFRRAPLLFAALSFALGDTLAHTPSAYRPTLLLLAAAALLLTLIALTLHKSLRLTLLPLLALWLLTGLWCAQIEPGPPTQTALQQASDGVSRTLLGHVIRIRQLPPYPATVPPDQEPDPSDWDAPDAPPILSFDLAVDALEHLAPDLSRLDPLPKNSSAGVRITVLGDAPIPTLHCGDTLQLPARLRTPDRFRDPGAWQYADFLASQGIGALASVPASRLTVVSATRPTLRCTLASAQTWAAARLLAFVASPANRTLPRTLRLTPDDAGMLNAMLFGDRDRLTHTLRLNFERTGSFHLFVVSGMHVALLAGGLFWIARARLRLGNLWATLLTLALTTAYALLTGFGAPVQRALLMASLFLLTRLLSRTRNIANAFGAAALGVLVLSPRSLFESGFQMTFLSIVAIAGIAVPLGERTFVPYARAAAHLDHLWLDRALPPRVAQFRLMLRLFGEALRPCLGPIARLRLARNLPAVPVRFALHLLQLTLIGLTAELVMALPMALYFHRATLFALPANIFSIPLVALLAPLAILTFLLSLLNAWLAVPPAAATALVLHGIAALIGHIGHLHAADWRVPGPPLAIALLALLAWAFCCWAARRSHPAGPLAAALLLPLTAVAILWPYPPTLVPHALEVTAIDVGQGDSLLLASPTGQTMLVDAGGPVGSHTVDATSASSQNTAFDIGEEVVSPYLWSRRIHHLDVVVLTHAHSDHMGGMPAILRNFRPRELWVGIDPTSAPYQALLHEAADLGIAVRHLHAGQTIPWPSAHSASRETNLKLTVLAPAATYRNPNAPTNDDSLVLRLDYGLASALLEGDAESPTERAMLASGLHPVTLLKVGHHGSRTSTTPDFLAALAPREAVVSVGRHNTFGHPRFEVLSRLADAHTLLYRTDEFGLTRFLLTPDGRIQESNQQPTSPLDLDVRFGW